VEALAAPGSVERAVRARWPEADAEPAAVRMQALVRRALVRRRRLWAACRGASTAAVCAPVAARLQTHQWAGVRWLFDAYTAGGGILADDPGLGKTLQAIALVEAVVRARLATRVLVVAPANLVKVWAGELSKWLGKEHALTTVIVGADVPGLAASARLRDLAALPPPARPRPPPSAPPRAAAGKRKRTKLAGGAPPRGVPARRFFETLRAGVVWSGVRVRPRRERRGGPA